MHKVILAAFLLFSGVVFGVRPHPSPTDPNERRIEDAPLEWLIVQTFHLKVANTSHNGKANIMNDKLVRKIFSVADYDRENDELILQSSFETRELRGKLIDYLKDRQLPKRQTSFDPLYEKWVQEKSSKRDVQIKARTKMPGGIYYFNHVHTDLSEDNEDLEFLKFSPKRTFEVVEEFLEDRGMRGSLVLTDHNTDQAFDKIKNRQSSRLTSLRSVEWGGKIHLGLIGVEKNWPLVTRGRDFHGEEAIKVSRESGGLRIINHPFRGDDDLRLDSWLDVQGIEVWNTVVENVPFSHLGIRRSQNREVMGEWEESLRENKQYTALAGSDFHFTIPCLRDRTLHYPANFIPTKNPDKTRELLERGRVSFLTRPTAPKLNLQAKFNDDSQWAKMGETLNGEGEVRVRLLADFSDKDDQLNSVCYNVVRSFWRLLTFWKKRRWEIRFYNLAGDVVGKKEIDPRKYGEVFRRPPRGRLHSKSRNIRSLEAKLRLPVQSREIIRAELWQINDETRSVDLLGATNPIYFNFHSM